MAYADELDDLEARIIERLKERGASIVKSTKRPLRVVMADWGYRNFFPPICVVCGANLTDKRVLKFEKRYKNGVGSAYACLDMKACDTRRVTKIAAQDVARRERQESLRAVVLG